MQGAASTSAPLYPTMMQQQQQQQPQPQPASTSSLSGPSPTKDVPTVSRPVKSGFDLRAEEEAARRMNAGRVNVSGAASGSTKNSDLFGRGALRKQLSNISREFRMDFDEDALQYLALAAETRLRALLQDSLAAQFHRTTTSHVRPPPQSASGKPIWSHHVVSDPQAVMDAVNRANKEAEQTFRASRMDRLARETEIQRAKEKADKATEEDMVVDAGPSTPAKASPSSAGASTPTFGGVSEKKSIKKSGKKAKDVSAEVAHKMSNATAMRSVGMFGKKQYSWLNSVPNVSSPLSGRKRKGERDGETAEGTHEPQEAVVNGQEKVKTKAKGADGADRPKRKRPRLSQPTRREIVVSRDDKGVEKKVQDDQAITVADILFALERDGLGRGTGSTDDLVRRIAVLGGIHPEQHSA